MEAQFRAGRAERDRLAAEVERLRVDNQRLQTRPHAIRRLLQQALAVRDAGDAGQLGPVEVAAEAKRLSGALDKLIAGRTSYPPNPRLLNHLANEREHLFTFLRVPGV